jgi:H+/Cl- antiporter ClcA
MFGMYYHERFERRREMNRLQKLAWFNLVVLGGTVLVSLSLVAWAWTMVGWRAISFLGLLAVGGVVSFLGPLFIRKDRDTRRVQIDERDAEIVRQSEACGSVTIWAVLVAAFAFSALARGLDGSVGVPSMGLTIATAYVVSKLVESATLLLLYREGRGDGEQ